MNYELKKARQLPSSSKRMIATYVPEEIYGKCKCNGLIVHVKMEREGVGQKENRQSNPSYLT
jgi:hypothetical protein